MCLVWRQEGHPASKNKSLQHSNQRCRRRWKNSGDVCEFVPNRHHPGIGSDKNCGGSRWFLGTGSGSGIVHLHHRHKKQNQRASVDERNMTIVLILVSSTHILSSSVLVCFVLHKLQRSDVISATCRTADDTQLRQHASRRRVRHQTSSCSPSADASFATRCSPSSVLSDGGRRWRGKRRRGTRRPAVVRVATMADDQHKPQLGR